MRTLTMGILLLVGVSFAAAASDPQSEENPHGGELVTDSCAAGGPGCDTLNKRGHPPPREQPTRTTGTPTSWTAHLLDRPAGSIGQLVGRLRN
jgi:hypothetical protein